MSNVATPASPPSTFIEGLRLVELTIPTIPCRQNLFKRLGEVSQRQLKTFGLTLNDRLTYRPQPLSAIRAEQDGNVHSRLFNATWDGSYSHFTSDAWNALGGPYSRQINEAMALEQLLSSKGIDFLTIIDAYATVPMATNDALVVRSIELLDSFTQEQMRTLTYKPGTDPKTVLRNGASIALLFRWMLYKARRNGDGMEKLQQDLVSVYVDFAPPPEWSVLDSVEKGRGIAKQILHEYEFDDIFPPIDLYTTPTNGAGDACVICMCQSDVLTNVCNHPYCEECLTTWVETGEANARKCGYCRQEMFPEFQDEEKLRTLYDSLRQVERSIKWFCEELYLQQQIAELMKDNSKLN